MSDKKNPPQTIEQMNEELKRLEVEAARLNLEDLRERVAAQKTRREEMARRHEAQQQSIDDANRQILAQQESCKHRKGGKGLEGILNGHDSYFSVIKNVLPWGETMVMCTRCCKEWRKPTDELRKTDKAAYNEQMRDYKEALNMPTDNETSGSQLFLVQQTA